MLLLYLDRPVIWRIRLCLLQEVALCLGVNSGPADVLSTEFQDGVEEILMRFPPLVPKFLREFGSTHIEGPQLLHTRALLSAIKLMGYTLDEHFPSAERP